MDDGLLVDTDGSSEVTLLFEGTFGVVAFVIVCGNVVAVLVLLLLEVGMLVAVGLPAVY